MFTTTTITTKSRIVKNIIINQYHPMMIRMVSVVVNTTSSYLHTTVNTCCTTRGTAILKMSMPTTTGIPVNHHHYHHNTLCTTLNNNINNINSNYSHRQCGGNSFNHYDFNNNLSNLRKFSTTTTVCNFRHSMIPTTTTSSSSSSPPRSEISTLRITTMSSTNHPWWWRSRPSCGIQMGFMKKTNSLWYYYSSTCTILDDEPPAQQQQNTNMADEYSATATMDEMSYGNTCTIPNFTLECGITLPIAQIRYRTYGISPQTTKDHSNVIVICHALTGNASIDTWWSTLLGPNKAFDTNQYHIICCNILGSCYGSTSPISINPNTHVPYGIDFPMITVQDTVRIQLECLQQHFKLQSIQCVIGGSFGGMQTLEYAIQGNHIAATTTATQSSSSSPSSSSPYIKSIIPIACNAQHSAWQIAISEIQRQMIYQDIQWSKHHQYHLATKGLQLARQMAMISYRTAIGYSNKFGRRCMTPTKINNETTTNDVTDTTTVVSTVPPPPPPPQWEVSNYLKYQGEKFVHQRQFDPITYVKLTQQMDSHDICRNRIVGYNNTVTTTNNNNNNNNTNTTSDEENVATILQQITIPTLVLGIDSDILYPIQEQELLAKYIPNSKFYIIHSIEGHDGFLIEQQQVGTYIQQFLSSL